MASLRRVALLVAASLACTPGGFGDSPVVWPRAARLGDTVAMSIDSNHVPLVGPFVEKYDLTEDNVTLELRAGATLLATLAPRAVFDGLSAPASLRNATSAGPFLTIVVFDLPASLPISLPATVNVTLLVGGAAPAFPVAGTLELLGSGGSPTVFTSESQPEGLGPRPMLRLQGRKAGPGGEGFDPAWPIGAIEFVLEYPAAAVSAPDVFPTSEASRALAFTSTDGVAGRVRVVLTDPRGFALPAAPGYPGGDRVGEGPLLDVAFEKAPGQGFAPEDFTIRELRVYSPDGVLLTPVFGAGTDTTHYFARIARRNLAE